MNSRILEKKLLDYGVEGRVVEVRPGPVITVYEFEPAPGVKVSRIVNLADDLALALSAVSIRIVAPIPGKSVVGIEIPNHHTGDRLPQGDHRFRSLSGLRVETLLWTGKGYLRRALCRRSCQNAPSPGGRINRVRKERLHQFDDLQHSL